VWSPVSDLHSAHPAFRVANAGGGAHRNRRCDTVALGRGQPHGIARDSLRARGAAWCPGSEMRYLMRPAFHTVEVEFSEFLGSRPPAARSGSASRTLTKAAILCSAYQF
jgi:hypothetical protein